MRKVVVAVIVFLAASAAYAGEKPLSFQVFPYFGGWFGDEYFTQSWLVGGRVGFNINQVLGLEVGLDWAPQKFRGYIPDQPGLQAASVNASLPYADFVVNLGKSRKLVPYGLLGGGDLILNVKNDDIENPPNQAVVMWGLGLKYYFTEMFGLRLEARQLFIGEDYPRNLALTAGVQLRFGGHWPAQQAPKVVEAPPRVVDSDGDTVPDDKDKCPNTPAGAKVDRHGCPIDSDGDTVPDITDQCPDTPKGVAVNNVGCPIDSDGDTVPDNLDKCPNTPPGTKVDQNGCPIKLEEAAPPPPKDSDGDTVPDDIDKCPNTPPGSKVDAAGCPMLIEREAIKGIKFKTGQAIIDPSSYPILDKVVQALKDHPAMKVEIQGYTDNKGKAASNIALSQARARAVYNYLVKKGISPKRITYKGYGPANPVAPNDTEQGRAQNRRIEFKILQ